ncbi:MAG: dicarboxylate/amino acid:cation symporter [Planctomycetota bacterium]|nr:MAG: dicarboxylate/amino acid:cation symporter [Planctomycetota bacterium]
MKLLRLPLYTKILIGLLAGVIFGILANRFGFSDFVFNYIKPIGSAFIRLISMVVVPLVFASLLVGTASLNDIRKLGRIGVKTVAYYLCTTAIAITIGLLLANAFRPGAGLSEQAQKRLIQNSSGAVGVQVETALEKPTLTDILLNIIPTNPVKAFVEGKMLQIIFFALLTGICLSLISSERSRPVINFFEGVNEVVIQMVHIIMKIAPYGVFALISAVITDFGLDILFILLKYSTVVIVGLVLHAVVIYSLAIKLLGKQKIATFFRGIRPAQLIAFSTGSSSATLPVTMECTEKNLGVPREICSFALPLGATVNMNGTALYQGVSAVFIAQVYGMGLTMGQQLAIVLTATLASIGTAGTPAAGVMTLAIVLRSIGVPLEGIAIILGVERILDMCRTVVNITGDASCAVIVASTERELQEPLANSIKD